MKFVYAFFLIFFGYCGAAHAQSLDLICAWPNNPCCDTIVRVELANAMVTSYNRNVPNEVFTVQGRVSPDEIAWNYTVRGFRVYHRIDRIRGMLYSQNQHDTYDPMPCTLAKDVKPKF